MHAERLLLRVACSFVLLAPPLAAAEPADGPERWESAIRKFEEADRESPPPKGGIVFIGSSSIVRWDVEKAFPGLPVINRGFGGSQMADSVAFASRIVVPYRPQLVIVYAGDNDLARDKTAEQLAADTQAFVDQVHAALPAAQVIVLPVKPSIKRWSLIETQREANQQVAAMLKERPWTKVVDVATPMLGEDGQPRAELFVEDGLHLSAAGYELWNKILAPHLHSAAK